MFNEKKLFVTKDVAILAKNNGFYDPCISGVIGNEIITGVGFGITNHSNIHDYAIPLCQQLVDWFRDNHNLWISISIGSEFMSVWTIDYKSAHTCSGCADYYEAYDDAFKAAFRLIS